MKLRVTSANTFQSSSFHNTIVTTTPSKLIALAEHVGAEYDVHNTGDDKSNFGFDFQTTSGIYFTAYDWKEYRALSLDEYIDFHIGGDSKSNTDTSALALIDALSHF
jgi:hypothetical protein